MKKRLQIRRGETANFYAGVHGRSQDFSKGGGGVTLCQTEGTRVFAT